MPITRFNPRPREEGDATDNTACNYEIVSIHALAKRATRKQSEQILIGDVSIHALAKRATGYTIMARSPITSFNPRPREEGDNLRGRKRSSLRCFNPRPREEGDEDYQVLYGLQKVSIHALAKRATNVVVGSRKNTKFQSTPSRRGRRQWYCKLCHRLYVSIHALAKRATQIRL